MWNTFSSTLIVVIIVVVPCFLHFTVPHYWIWGWWSQKSGDCLLLTPDSLPLCLLFVKLHTYFQRSCWTIRQKCNAKRRGKAMHARSAHTCQNIYPKEAFAKKTYVTFFLKTNFCSGPLILTLGILVWMCVSVRFFTRISFLLVVHFIMHAFLIFYPSEKMQYNTLKLLIVPFWRIQKERKIVYHQLTPQNRRQMHWSEEKNRRSLKNDTHKLWRKKNYKTLTESCVEWVEGAGEEEESQWVYFFPLKKLKVEYTKPLVSRHW